MPRLTFGNFSLDAPSGWSLSSVILAGPVESNPLTRGMLTTKAVRPFTRNLITTLEHVDDTEAVESYMNRQIEGLRQAGVSREEVKREKVTLAGGLEGLLTEQVIVTESGERVRQMQLMSLKEGVMYTVIASHLDGIPFDAVRDEFRTMLLSFS